MALLWQMLRGGLIQLLHHHLRMLCWAHLRREAYDVFWIGMRAGLSVSSVG